MADLPKLEAAILGARKVGAHEIDADAYHAATELRVKLDAASKARTALENALRTLQRGGRPEDVAEVERLIENATAFGELLASDAAKSKEAVAQWQAASVAESKLERVLQEGGGAAALSKAIKDATAAGVKVTEARRILKLMQALEAAIAAAHAEGGSALNGLQSKIQAAVSGGVPHAIVADARRTLHRLTLADVRSELDAALKMTRATEQRPVSQRFALLKAVLERVDAVLAMGDGTGAEGDDHGATEERADAHTATSPSLQLALSLGSTDSSHDGVLLALPKGKLRSQGSFASQVASSSAASTPTWAYAAAAAGGGLADCEAIVVRMKPVGDVVAVWFEPAPGVDELSSSECEDDALPPEGEGDDEAAVRHMARVARRRLNREGREHQRLEREKAEEARVRRELQAKEKAAREVADRERAERARAERAERKAALEAQKAERRERERAQRLEREKARQGREAQAREHFLLLQRQRRELAEQARAAQIAQLLAAQSVQHGFFGAPSPEEPSAQWLSVPGHSPDPSIDLSATGVLGILEEDPLADAGAAAAAAAQGAAFEATSEGFATNPASLAGTTSDAASAGQSTLWSSQDGKGLGDAAEEAFPGPNARLFGDLGGATWLSRNTAGLGLDVPVSSSAPPTTGGELLTSSGLLWGSTGGGMDGSGASAFGLPGVGANQGWSSGQGSAATSAMVNTSLAAADREAQLSKALDAAKALLKVQQAQQAHQAQRVCKYYAQGYCREGERCRFVHSLQNNGLAMNALQPPVTLPMQQGSSVSMGSAPTSNAVAASSFAFGAPGSKEFSSFGGVSSGQRPAMSGASGAQLGSSFLLGSGGAANSLSGGGGLGPFGSLPLDSQTTMGGLGGGLGGPLNVRSLPEQTSALATAVGMSTPHISGVASTGGTPRGGGLHWGSGAFGAGQDGSDAGPGVNASLFADFLFSNGAQDGLSGADKGTNGGL